MEQPSPKIIISLIEVINFYYFIVLFLPKHSGYVVHFPWLNRLIDILAICLR